MGNLTSITDTIGDASASINEFIGEHPIVSVVGAGLVGAAVGGAAGYMVGKNSSKKKRTSKSKYKRKRSSKRRSRSGRARDRRYISKQKWERYYAKTHPKRRKTGKYYKSKSKRVKHTKNGQPYIILSNGRARFIKKR